VTRRVVSFDREHALTDLGRGLDADSTGE